MSTLSRHLWSRRSWTPLGRSCVVAMALVSISGCCRGKVESAWKASLAQQTLVCLHPTGIFDSTDHVVCRCGGGNCELSATIYWRGRATDANYLTSVRLRTAGGEGNVYVVEDTSIVPAMPNCRIPVPTC